MCFWSVALSHHMYHRGVRLAALFDAGTGSRPRLKHAETASSVLQQKARLPR